MRSHPARSLALAACLAMGAPAALAAQATARDSLCSREAAAELVEGGMTKEEADSEVAKAGDAPCKVLADGLVDRVSTPPMLDIMLDHTPARDFQSRASGNAGTAGAPSQGEAVPSVQPLALAGGSLAAVGSDGGTDAIAAFTINPAILFGAQDPARAAALSRLLDLTVLAPVNELDRDQDGKIDYYGIRARVNVTGPGAGKQLQKAVKAFADNVQKSAILSARLDTVLRETPNFATCVDAFRAKSVKAEEVTSSCGRELDIAPDPKTLESFREALALARDSADARYLGLDVRLDQGDPTLGATPAAAGTALFAGLAFGRNIVALKSNQPSFGLKARLGVHHVSLDDTALGEGDRNNTAVDGALAFDFTYPYEFQPLKFAAGLEFRAGDPPVSGAEKEFQTNFLQARLSLDVPITAANSISIAFAGPLTGKERPTLSINGNWQLLLSGLSAVGKAAQTSSGR
jgi:hypothetical protein